MNESVLKFQNEIPELIAYVVKCAASAVPNYVGQKITQLMSADPPATLRDLYTIIINMYMNIAKTRIKTLGAKQWAAANSVFSARDEKAIADICNIYRVVREYYAGLNLFGCCNSGSAIDMAIQSRIAEQISIPDITVEFLVRLYNIETMPAFFRVLDAHGMAMWNSMFWCINAVS